VDAEGFPGAAAAAGGLSLRSAIVGVSLVMYFVKTPFLRRARL
jgi:hypothetical protein